MKGNILRVGIVGAGYISSYHIKSVVDRDDAELVSICDLNEQAAVKAVSGIDSVKIYTELEDMLAQQALDVVHILTQPDSHLRLARQTIDAGCQVILEKPVTVNLTEALELKELAQKQGVKIAINHNFVFSRPFNELVKLLETGKLGPLKSIRVVWKKVLQQVNYGPWNLWMLRSPENILFETGAHSFSELLAIISSPKIFNVRVNRAKILPSGSTFYRRWNIICESDDINILIDCSYDQGYEQHYIEVEGKFGVAKADIENDVFSAHLPTGLTYDAERLNVNLRTGFKKIKDAIRTYLSYATSKFSSVATGAPYETSMLNGINNCYELIIGNPARRESTIDYAIEIAQLAEKIQQKMPQPNHPDELPVLPHCAQKPHQDCKILIIGASGFIGKRLFTGLMKHNKSVRAIVRNPSALIGISLNDTSEIIIGDFRDTELMQQALQGIDTVYHLAVAHSNSLSGYLRVDSEPTLRLAEMCLDMGIKRFVYTGTIDSLYLGPNAGLVQDQDGVDKVIKRRNNYAHSKAITEGKLSQLAKDKDFPLVIVRPAIVLGAGGPVNHVGVANWFGLGRCDFWGKGSNLLPLILVDDVVSALIAVESARGIEGKTYNLSAKSSITAQEYVNEVEQVLGSKIHTDTSHHLKLYLIDTFKWIIKLIANHPDKTRIPSIRDWRCREQHAEFDITHAQRDLNWSPENDKKIIIEKGIHEPTKLFLES